MATSKSKTDQIRDEALRRMLTTPHKKHSPLKPKRKAKAKKPAR